MPGNKKQRKDVTEVLDYLDAQKLPDDFMRHPPALRAWCENFMQQLLSLNQVLLDCIYSAGDEDFSNGMLWQSTSLSSKRFMT